MRRGRRLFMSPVALGVGLLAVSSLLVGCIPRPSPTAAVLDAACNGTLVASTPGTVAATDVTELSGLSASRRTAGVWWAHNDSGHPAEIFAVGDDGRDLGTYTLSGANAVDWEDIAAGPGPDAGASYLYIADTGDNTQTRASVQVYRVPEPQVDPNGGPHQGMLTDVATLDFTYPDGPHDAEALIVDPSSGRLLIITKDVWGDSQVFAAPGNLASGTHTTLTQVATLHLGFLGLVTAGDITPARDTIALRTYGSVVMYPLGVGDAMELAFLQVPCYGAVANEAQGEAIGFTGDGRGYVTASEGASPALHRFVAP
ncbi:MAG TPA: hypothetical protein VFZ17_13345 [Acidimicrobiia bacterium]|nr:hypothetical protein [Acidimicrobiia bacterium]